MPIKCVCPKCGTAIAAPDAAAGRAGRCPKCGESFLVPFVAPTPSQTTQAPVAPPVVRPPLGTPSPVAAHRVSAPPMAVAPSTGATPVSPGVIAPLPANPAVPSFTTTRHIPRRRSSSGSLLVFLLLIVILAGAGVAFWLIRSGDAGLAGIPLPEILGPRGPEVTWYTADSLPGVTSFDGVSLTAEAKEKGVVLLAVEGKVAMSAIPTRKVANVWEYELKAAWSTLRLPDGSTLTGDGLKFGSNSGFNSATGITVTGAELPDEYDWGVFFAIKKSAVDAGGLRYQFRELPLVGLNESNRKQK